MTVAVSSLGFPRIGPRRELKRALEAHWSGALTPHGLKLEAARLRAAAWKTQAAHGVDILPSNDFSLYDHVLDAIAMLGAAPDRSGWREGPMPLDVYFSLARGRAESVMTRGRAGDGSCSCGDGGVAALEMTKWFDTNYHYLAPELFEGQSFRLGSTQPVHDFLEAKTLGLHTRPVLLGPVTFLKLGKVKTPGLDRLTLLPGLLPVYAEVLTRLADAGADGVQIDEPVLALDLTDAERTALSQAYAALSAAEPRIKILVASYFGGLGDNLATALALPVAGLHLDLVRAPDQLAAALAGAPDSLTLSLGVVDGRNIWKADLSALLDRLEPALAQLGPERLILAPSCSLLHTPLDLAQESKMTDAVKARLAFAVQKLDELQILARALNDGRDSVAAELAASDRLAASLRHVAPPETEPAPCNSRSDRALRRRLQAEALRLPPLPTTTIGSFPQTQAVRVARADHQRGEISAEAYAAFLQTETTAAIRWQEEIGLDVLVHGEFERNDMVQYFAERLDGFALSQHGWVQSYGSRCVRPPILYGPVSRPAPMTVDDWRFAQGLTPKPVKGMLTGPVTILQWSFVRDDQPRRDTCLEIAVAVAAEVADLEAAGAKIIQIDEAALREGLPLRRADHAAYLAWATAAFRRAASGASDAVQVHTHMCYSEFSDILDALNALDADVISIETARSNMDLLAQLHGLDLGADLGPGVYDIHSPRLPGAAEIEALIDQAAAQVDVHRLWINPDCGLKTRRWEEVRPAVAQMVEAAMAARQKLFRAV